MSNPNLNPVNVIQETFNRLGDVYFSLLIIPSPFLVFSLIVGLSIYQLFFSNLSNFPNPANLNLPNPAIIVLVVLIGVILALWYTAASWIYCHKVLNRQNISVGKAFEAGLSPIISLFIASIIVSLILLVGFVCLIIPGIYLLIRLNLTFYAIAVENCSAFEGIKRSWQLTRGHFWSVFLVLLLLPILLSIFPVISGMVGIVLAFIPAIQDYRDLFSLVFGYLFTPIPFLYTAIMYNHLTAIQSAK